MGAIRKKIRRISLFIKLSLLFALMTAVLFYITNHVFILGWNVFTRSLFKIMVYATLSSAIAVISFFIAGAIYSSKRVQHQLEKLLREFHVFLRQFHIDKMKKKQKWGAIVLFIGTPVLLLFMIALTVSFTETCTPEFTIAFVLVIALIGIYLLYYDSWMVFKGNIRYFQCRKCRSYTMSVFEKEPRVIKCRECGYPELLDEGPEMEKRGFIRTQCNSCRRTVLTRKKTRKRLHCPYCRKIIYYD